MDLNQNVSMNMTSPQVKTCADCRTTKTPLWRGGPAGPRSLCNACGIRQRKQRRALLGLGKDGSEKIKKKNHNNDDDRDKKGSKSNEMGVSLNLELVELGREMVLKKRKLREEEEAAILLMALSCGSVFA